MSQYSVLRLKIHPKASSGEEEDDDAEEGDEITLGDCEGVCFSDISELIVSGEQGESESESIDVGHLIASLPSSTCLTQQRQIPPSVNISVSGAVYAPGRGVCGVLLARKNVPEGVILYDLEEEEEEEEEEGDEEKGEESDQDTMVI
jgi:hypothetical protein